MAAYAGIAVVVVIVLGFLFDVTTNFDKIHSGVTLQGVDIGGMTREEAALTLQAELGVIANASPVDLFGDETQANAGVDDETVELDLTSTSYETEEATSSSHSWRITATTVGATVDGAALAEEAFKVGRGEDFLAGRLTATFKGVELPGSLTYESAQLSGLENILSASIGWPMENADIYFEYEDGTFSVQPSVEGLRVNHANFIKKLDAAFLTEARSQVVPMEPIPVGVTDAQAENVAAATQAALEQSVALVYENEDSWSLDPYTLGSWITTGIQGEGPQYTLFARIDADRLESGIYSIIGDRDPGIKPINAKFEVVDDQVTIRPSQPGTGVDYAKVTESLNAILFPPGEPVKDRRVALTVTTLAPSFSTEDAEAYGITDKIGSYTTEYTVASSAKVTNIHLAADLLNNSLIAPEGTWSFNGTAGNCNEERGFQKAKSIVEGEYVDEIGGGICQVATTVFNAVFDSGLPIAERVNHGFYLIAYPAGRDATVSWQWPDLKFDNDTGHWMLLTMSYTDNSVTCTLWGTNPGYTVESSDSGFTDRTDFEKKEVENPELAKGESKLKQEGVRGRTIVVTRYVYNSAGELLRKTDFKSVYAPEPEIKEVGTKEVPKEEAKPAGETKPA
jgi:vancomycin resistance protein YoaR